MTNKQWSSEITVNAVLLDGKRDVARFNATVRMFELPSSLRHKDKNGMLHKKDHLKCTLRRINNDKSDLIPQPWTPPPPQKKSRTNELDRKTFLNKRDITFCCRRAVLSNTENKIHKQRANIKSVTNANSLPGALPWVSGLQISWSLHFGSFAGG